MRQKPQHVMQSINMHGETVCVDFFRRDNGTFGFEEYRRDVETRQGWFPIGFYSGNVFATLDEARAAAKLKIAWLEEEM